MDNTTRLNRPEFLCTADRCNSKTAIDNGREALLLASHPINVALANEESYKERCLKVVMLHVALPCNEAEAKERLR